MGGKQKIAKKLCNFIQPFVNSATAYYEPFMGGGAIASRIEHDLKFLSDANLSLITMWKAVVEDGWIPPSELSESEYKDIKKRKDPNDPLTAFALFGCSFAGDWARGYAKNSKQDNYALRAQRSILKKLQGLKGSSISCMDYKDIEILHGSVVYCDPPYENTAGYSAVGPFDTEEFWEWVRDTSRIAKVFVSEYKAPSDFTSVWHEHTKTGLRDKDGNFSNRIENLFCFNETVEEIMTDPVYSPILAAYNIAEPNVLF